MQSKHTTEKMKMNDQLQCMIAREQFPEKLYAILELARSESRGCSSDVVTWLPHGRAFRVLDVDRFMRDIVPMFFNQTKIRSFHRQLNLWGFKRLSAWHRDSDAWYHEHFMRGSPNKLKKLKRIKIKSRMKPEEATNKVVEEPDFYRMSPLPEVDMDHPLTKLLREISSEDASSNSKVSSSKEVQLNPSSFPSEVGSATSFGPYNATYNQEASALLSLTMMYQLIHHRSFFTPPFTCVPQCHPVISTGSSYPLSQSVFQDCELHTGRVSNRRIIVDEVTSSSTVPSCVGIKRKSSSFSQVPDDGDLFEPLPYNGDSFESDDFSDYIAETIRTL